MSLRLALVLSALLASPGAFAGDALAEAAVPAGCEAFARDVSGEMAAMGTPSPEVTAGRGGSEAVRIAVGRRHDVGLHPLGEVALVAEPGKAMPEGAMAGLLVFQVPADGRYRVSLTTAHWLDVADVADGVRVLASLDHEGQRGCPLLRKVVEFELPGGRDLMLQLVGGTGTTTAVLVTPSVPATK